MFVFSLVGLQEGRESTDHGTELHSFFLLSDSWWLLLATGHESYHMCVHFEGWCNSPVILGHMKLSNIHFYFPLSCRFTLDISFSFSPWANPFFLSVSLTQLSHPACLSPSVWLPHLVFTCHSSLPNLWQSARICFGHDVVLYKVLCSVKFMHGNLAQQVSPAVLYWRWQPCRH